MIIIKNDKGQICDYRPYIDIDIEEIIKNMNMLIDEYKQKLYETTMIPKDRL